MAKQTFTTGSVLTATQMNNLQANDYNWTVSQKTASYVLVAADAGTRIEMNAAGSTTVTVNTGLFTAGDSVIIQNIGAGTCTVTAGTATVNKATNASLALAQYQGGTLYFVNASSAIFFPFDIGSGGSTKNFSLLGTGTLNTGSTVTVSGISSQDMLMIRIINASGSSASAAVRMLINGDTGSNYKYAGYYIIGASTYAAGNLLSDTSAATFWPIAQMGSNAASLVCGYVLILGGATAGVKTIISGGSGDTNGGGNSQIAYSVGGVWNNTATITSIGLTLSGGTFDNGTFEVYGAS